jgi:hypothetical protein
MCITGALRNRVTFEVLHWLGEDILCLVEEDVRMLQLTWFGSIPPRTLRLPSVLAHARLVAGGQALLVRRPRESRKCNLVLPR